MLNTILPDEPKKWMRESQEQLGIFLLRSMFSLLWLSQAGIKIVDRSDIPNDDYHGFLGQLYWIEDSNPISFISYLVRKFLIPNVDFVVWVVICTELFIAFSLGFGFLTRLGSFVGMSMSFSLWVLTLGWDEWLWTYPLIFFPHVLFFLARSGREIGFDKAIANKKDNKILSMLT